MPEYINFKSFLPDHVGRFFKNASKPALLICDDLKQQWLLPGGAGEGEEVEDLLMLDLTHEEIKAAFRLFDDSGEGFITVNRFRVKYNDEATT